MDKIKLELTAQQLSILLESITGANWPGKLLEVGVELKKVLADAIRTQVVQAGDGANP